MNAGPVPSWRVRPLCIESSLKLSDTDGTFHYDCGTTQVNGVPTVSQVAEPYTVQYQCARTIGGWKRDVHVLCCAYDVICCVVTCCAGLRACSASMTRRRMAICAISLATKGSLSPTATRSVMLTQPITTRIRPLRPRRKASRLAAIRTVDRRTSQRICRPPWRLAI